MSSKIETREKKAWGDNKLYKITTQSGTEYQVVVGSETFTIFRNSREILGSWKKKEALTEIGAMNNE